MVTIKEIAEMAGTSRGTVDRVINGRGKVRPELETKIRAIIERENYRPNPLGRALVNIGNPIALGVVVNSIGNPFFDRVLDGLHYRTGILQGFGAEVFIEEIKGYGAAEQIDAIERLLRRNVAGLAITPIDAPEIKEKLGGINLPIVTFNTDVDVGRLAFIGCDYHNSGMVSGDLAVLILPQGGKVVAVIGNHNISGHRLRVEGFREAVAEKPAIRITHELENQDDDDLSYKLISELLAGDSPDLIYFGAGGISGGVRAVIESGKKVRVLAVDGTDTVREYLNSGHIAATVTQQPFVQGDKALAMLYEYLSTGIQPENTVIYTESHVILRHTHFHAI